MSVTWLLSFTFSVDAAGAGPRDPIDISEAKGTGSAAPVRVLAAPLQREVETVRWQLPLEVLPADPMHVPFRRAVVAAAIGAS